MENNWIFDKSAPVYVDDFNGIWRRKKNLTLSVAIAKKKKKKLSEQIKSILRLVRFWGFNAFNDNSRQRHYLPIDIWDFQFTRTEYEIKIFKMNNLAVIYNV